MPRTFLRTLPSCWTMASVAVLLAGCGGNGTPDAPTASANVQQACAALAGKTVAGAAVGAAETVAAAAAKPRYCRVAATIAPQLHLELRLPEQWNGKLYYEGGGGYDGSIAPLAGGNLAALKQGYATVNSDGGHTDSALSAAFALDDSVAARLFGSQSVPTVAQAAKEMLATAYGKRPGRSYFEGCSGGGREALMAAERNPSLFDGIVARAPGYNWVGLMAHFNRNSRAVAAPGGQFSSAKLTLLAKAVRTACDDKDGIADGIVSNPRACSFDPSVLRCAGGADTGDSCLSDAQLAVIASRTSAVSVANGTYTDAGLPLNGGEDDAEGGWGPWVTGGGDVRQSLHYLFQDTTVKNYLARNPAQDSLTYAWESNLATVHQMAALNDATDTDLRPFKAARAKLILWHGGSDPSLSPGTTTAFYEGAVQAVGGQAAADDFMRYYIAPGVNHCEGGLGADQSDLLGALDTWVDKGTAPETLAATRVVQGAVQASRPLCRYPQYPRYVGPANDAAAAALASNYRCTMP